MLIGDLIKEINQKIASSEKEHSLSVVHREIMMPILNKYCPQHVFRARQVYRNECEMYITLKDDYGKDIVGEWGKDVLLFKFKYAVKREMKERKFGFGVKMMIDSIILVDNYPPLSDVELENHVDSLIIRQMNYKADKEADKAKFEAMLKEHNLTREDFDLMVQLSK